ncbi:MAG: AMP-binding enzyme, partial [Polaromonas sp.]
VAEAAVLGLPDARWGEVPALALVAQPGVAPDLDGLRQHLASQLARFKQPQRTVLLPTLPRTALGKVQKAALRSLLMAPVTGA